MFLSLAYHCLKHLLLAKKEGNKIHKCINRITTITTCIKNGGKHIKSDAGRVFKSNYPTTLQLQTPKSAVE